MRQAARGPCLLRLRDRRTTTKTPPGGSPGAFLQGILFRKPPAYATWSLSPGAMSRPLPPELGADLTQGLLGQHRGDRFFSAEHAAHAGHARQQVHVARIQAAVDDDL